MAQARRRARLTRKAALLLALAGCASGPGAALLARHPELASLEGQRLADANPYVLPHAGSLTFFHCRWADGVPIPVSLPPDATAAERRALEAALRGWEGAGLGVAFAPVESIETTGRGIEIRFSGGAVDTPAGADTAGTAADCRIAPLSQQGGAAIAGAELVTARVTIARVTHDDLLATKPRALRDAELAGAALHELGHALGLHGHARQGDTVMVREVERIPRAGKALLESGRFSDATLRALYRLPSGAVVARAPVDRCRTDHVDRLARLAEEGALDGPFLRVGETAGRIWWRDAQGGEFGIVLARVREAQRDPNRLFVLAEARVRASLAEIRDVRCGAD
ncbi:MAG: hypothetical protein DCC71_22295 [Proteobacteria bacterium]|nr:MAG: hypothetical protein DCC71_22295 [Pseudomonadota bacterium]